MNKFKVGDIVVGLKNNVYLYTGEGSINEITDIKGPLIFVKVIKITTKYGSRYENRVGDSYWVDPRCFELENPNLENV